MRQTGQVIDYTSRAPLARPARRPRPGSSVRIGEPVEQPTELEHFVTARWGLHNDWFGRGLFLPNAHPRWSLHRAELLQCDEDLVSAAGLPASVVTDAPPISVLYSPGVPVRFGGPARPVRAVQS